VSLEAARIRLIMQLRQDGVTDTRVLSAVERTPRELFVPATFRHQAYENVALPIGEGQTISQPTVVALMTQALAIEPRMKVLEIGTGSGYQAAILARLARRVYTVERQRELLLEAQTRFDALKLRNIVTRLGDGSRGWPEQLAFDRIIVTAAAPKIPDALIDQLGPGGILVAPVGPAHGDQRLIRLRRSEGALFEDELSAVRFVPLISDQEAVRRVAQRGAAH
jgi:protein-L-isoaspartate(D-aspartate) O-methyltransferase